MEYVAFNGHSVEFNNWMEQRAKKMEAEIHQQKIANETPNIEKQVNEKV